ncbi:sigma-70 family RNA polymerase sigma factor [Chitinasiproducens palmae]|uniref:sigma-70 family RNA polymerase sigma factor n=1 Tax=Chitinasiproducens palmae TaxID=1770053 RepID=UPI00147E17AE
MPSTACGTASSNGALDHLYRAHHGWLINFLRKRLGNTCDAADLAHDTYLRLLATGRTPDTDSARPYLAHVAKCLAVDLHRRREIESAYLDTLAALAPRQIPCEETRAAIIETVVAIDRALQQLPAGTRAALLLSRLDGLSYRDIAARLAVSVSSVEKYVATALRACYDARYGSTQATHGS